MREAPFEPRDLLRQVEIISIMIRKKLWAQILLAMVSGLGVGLLLSPEGGALAPEPVGLAIAAWLKLPGAIFLNLIQMMVVPLVVSSIILGICAGGDPEQLKRVGARIGPYFVGTTTIAVLIGVGLALAVQPGAYIDADLLAAATASDAGTAAAASVESAPLVLKPLPERIADLIPTNIVEAEINRNMLQIVVFAIIVGIAIMALPAERGRSFLELLEVVQEIALKIVSWAMLIAPYAVFGLLADIAIRVGLEAIVGVSVYVGAVVGGLTLLLLFYYGVVALGANRSPARFAAQIREVQLLAFSTSSSAAVMPLSMRTAVEKLDVRPDVAKFIIPLGATVNMDGTALYQVIAALFLAQVYGIDLSAAQILILVLTTVGASIGSPSTPGVGIVILATILQGMGVPASGIALIIGVDRLLDMCRTTVNVTGDLTACVVMDRWLGAEKPAPRAATA